MITTCPGCGSRLNGLGTYCQRCGDYVVDIVARAETSTTDPSPEARPEVDPRSEAEIRMDIRQALGMLGWTVWDFEQGYRPEACSGCGAKVPGGTRVPRGIADLYVMGYGVGAWVEVKSSKGRQTEHQRGREIECVAAGVPYLVARSASEAVQWCEGLKASLGGAA